MLNPVQTLLHHQQQTVVFGVPHENAADVTILQYAHSFSSCCSVSHADVGQLENCVVANKCGDAKNMYELKMYSKH